MPTYTCTNCLKTFDQKGHFAAHKMRQRPCKQNNTIEALVEKKVKEVLEKNNVVVKQQDIETPTMPVNEIVKVEVQNYSTDQVSVVDYTTKKRDELIVICKEKNIKGYSGKKRKDLIAMLQAKNAIPQNISQPSKSTASQNYKVMSLFSGMGGMDVGFAEQVVVHKNSVTVDYIASTNNVPDFVNLKRLPFEIVFQNDILPAAKKVAELNHWNHNFHLKDIRDMLKENFVFPVAQVITGGFPCQDFSHAGKRQGFDSTRGTLYQSYVEVVKRVKPLVFVAENVHGLLTMPGEPINRIISDFSSVGYEVKYQLIKCEEFGIPQTRWRVIIMGVRLDKRHKLQDNWNIITENKLHCPIGCYFKHLQEPTVSNDPAQQVYSKAARLEKGQGQKEISLDECAPTMRAEHHGNIEFRRVTNGKNKEPSLPERRLTVREAALIQTFPPECILTEPVKPSSKAYKPIGNAVPPLLGYIIGRKVASILDAIKD
jgi:DNA (cytosine-5)-methyltransferase 1